jgi:hypothetical protein
MWDLRLNTARLNKWSWNAHGREHTYHCFATGWDKKIMRTSKQAEDKRLQLPSLEYTILGHVNVLTRQLGDHSTS